MSHQSYRNIILNSLLFNEADKELDTTEEIYIIADKRWISTQRKQNRSKHNKNDYENKLWYNQLLFLISIQ